MTLSFQVRPIGVRPLVTPYLDDRPHGVLATRSPTRPNPIGLSVVRLVERRPRFDAWSGRAGWVDDAPAPTTRDDGRFGGDPGSRG